MRSFTRFYSAAERFACLFWSVYLRTCYLIDDTRFDAADMPRARIATPFGKGHGDCDRLGLLSTLMAKHPDVFPDIFFSAF